MSGFSFAFLVMVVGGMLSLTFTGVAVFHCCNLHIGFLVQQCLH